MGGSVLLSRVWRIKVSAIGAAGAAALACLSLPASAASRDALIDCHASVQAVWAAAQLATEQKSANRPLVSVLRAEDAFYFEFAVAAEFALGEEDGRAYLADMKRIAFEKTETAEAQFNGAERSAFLQTFLAEMLACRDGLRDHPAYEAIPF